MLIDRRPLRRVCAPLLAITLLAALPATAGAGERRLSLSPCRLKGFGREAQCGWLEVFEDRAAGKGRKLKLKIAVLPALARDPQPDPVFLLAGGPGQSAIESFAPLLPVLQALRKTRDLVFVDQRGTGSSHKLQCEMLPKEADLKTRFEASLDPGRLQRCLRELDADVRQYTTAVAMDDLDEVRAALGYPRVNLWGGSYGTRAALVYARQHPDRVRTLTLDGVAPLSLRLPLYFARDGQRALELTVRQCGQDPGCSASFPDLEARFAALLAQLEQKPAEALVEDPLTGSPTRLTVTRRRFVENLRVLLYSPTLTALLPLTIDRASRGDYRAFVAQADQIGRGEQSLAFGMFLSVLCAEDAPFIGADEIDALAQGSFLGAHAAREMLSACKAWPRGALPGGFREPIRSEAPTLLLSGELDPVTPPGWAEEALRTLPNGVHLVAPGVGHGVSSYGCVPELLARFVERGSAKGLDASCVRDLKRPPFFVGFAGPRP
jgi:pimeloyl-ACP methyl ester carboxylesterase